jgi:septal ring factor EnvC (AmiA/AmiB activator)
MAQPPQQGWKIDKHIPVAVILAIILQTFGAIWWASSVTTRIEALERSRHSQEIRTEAHEKRVQIIEKDLPVIREKIENIKGTTDRIEKKLDKLSANFGMSDNTDMDSLMMLSLAELSEVRVS